jgi:hypothetical protein
LPPANPAAVVGQSADLACGIVLFDVWIANGDRHNRNIVHDRNTGRIQVFDHSHAFYSVNGGRAHLEANRNSLGIGGHCLAAEISSHSGLMRWEERIQAVPDFYIWEAVAEAVEVGLPEADKDFCAQFLLDRRQRLMDLIRNSRPVFPRLQPPLL